MKEVFIVQLKNDESSRFLLINCIENYYQTRGRFCSMVGGDCIESERFSMVFLIDRKHVFRYLIPIDVRNYFASLEIGIGPVFVSPFSVTDYADAQRFKKDATTEAVEQNLALLDELLAKLS